MAEMVTPGPDRQIFGRFLPRQIRFDLVHCEATFGGRSLDLTPREFDFLAYLARYAGKVCTRRMILENVWGPGYGRPARSLDDLLGEITPTFAAT